MPSNAERLNQIPPDRPAHPQPQLVRAPHLQQHETSQWRRNLDPTQFATLDALARLVARAAVLPFSPARKLPFPPTPPAPIDHTLGLDELDTLTRTRACYPFAELPTDLQEAVLSLIASRDLTSSKIDLALWLEDLLHHPPSHLRTTP
ncbi:MAG: hypothetical protein M3Y50_14040 [Acidobacteriota bacterium]|nr:hypothetical protein [Acidobacteriota bacterium]